MAATQCRACSHHSLSLVLDFGLMPPARRFLTPEMATRPEPIHPLHLHRCESCGLLQLDDVSGTEEIFAALPTTEAEAVSAAADPHVALASLARALPDRGAAVLTLPDLLQLHDELAYDLIGHETRAYYSISMLGEMATRHGLELIDVERDTDSPGLLCVRLQRIGGPLPVRATVAVTSARERAADLHRPGPWADFACLVEQARDMLNSELEEYLYRSRPVTAYSRGGRGMTMLSFCGNAPLRLPYFIDESAALHGMLTPGHRIPIVGPERLRTERPEAVLLLGRGWNPDDEGPLHEYWQSGGRILLPLPKPHYADAPTMAETTQRVAYVPDLSFSEYA